VARARFATGAAVAGEKNDAHFVKIPTRRRRSALPGEHDAQGISRRDCRRQAVARVRANHVPPLISIETSVSFD
jgi:hypothetical protein